ncbi:Efflux transport system, outer membrane factor (OMF) lipoprotein [Cupriavidus necator H850]|uniref:efflux transporter outer membrane subunit n=1 Tax=Cupriavidus necator TaxID=106590 RepID=UPI00129D8ECC|nr:efflux transporter outer membrane subunit [Cupriavidus necator]KAI3595226.1 Efflux transport system, outer membrane factor (OMF) lipoprotein [Cupriavidus necator H850]
MKRYRYAACALLVTLAAGCSLQPVYQRPAAPVSAAFPAGEAYKTASAGTASATLPAAEIGWRDFLADPRLQRLVELALQNNRDLRIAALNVRKVQAQYRIQNAALYPQVDAGASATAKSTSPGGSITGAGASHSYSAGLSASWEIDFFGRLQSLSDAAFEQYLASAYARQAAEILLVSEIADQYLTTLAYDEQLAVTQSTLETAQAAYKIVKLQFDTGTASELDLRLSETTVEQAQANYAAQVRLRAQAENALVLLVGQPLPPDLPAPVRLGDQPILTDLPAGLPSDLLQRRPDILQAEATLRSENANIGAARAAFFPRISLTGTLGTASAALGGLFAGGSSAWSFIPSLVMPIFTAGANQANLDVATVQKDIGIAQYEKTVQTAFREVADGLAARGTYDNQLAAQQRYTDTQQRRLALANMLYTSGTDSYLSVLTAQTDLYNAQQALVTTRLNRLTSLVDLYRSLGGGWIQRTGDAPRQAASAS